MTGKGEREEDDEESGMVTVRVRERERAMPQTSKPGPTLAVVAGTWILCVLAAMLSCFTASWVETKGNDKREK
jgi:hypothetical protein